MFQLQYAMLFGRRSSQQNVDGPAKRYLSRSIPPKNAHPLHFRQMNQERDVILFCDLHGHSIKKNILMYGNGFKGDTKYKERIFPFIL